MLKADNLDDIVKDELEQIRKMNIDLERQMVAAYKSRDIECTKRIQAINADLSEIVKGWLSLI